MRCSKSQGSNSRLKANFFHFARSGNGTPPPCKKWCQADRPSQVVPVGSWKEVIAGLNVLTPALLVSTKQTQYGTMPTCQPPSSAPAEEPDSPWDSWIEELESKAPESELQIPAMPLLSNKADSHNHRSKLELSWCPFPVAVTKMMSKKEMREIPEALEAMRK